MKLASWILGTAALVVAFAVVATAPRIFGVTPEPPPAPVGEAPPASPAEVKIDNFSFTPATITIAAGTAIKWSNHDDIPHNVVSDDKSFKSKVLDSGEEFNHTFSKPGTYNYFCSIHPKMTGKVVVQ